MNQISIIIPAHNESEYIQKTLQQLQPMRNRGHEIIVADGASTDDTAAKAKPLCDKIVRTEKNRALQMNAGAKTANGDIYWFLHADCIPPDWADFFIIKEIENQSIWGLFDVKLSGSQFIFRIIEFLMHARSCITKTATGDQGIFVRSDVFSRIQCFQQLPLMEDIEISRKLKKIKKPSCIRIKLTVSSRRWEKNGILAQFSSCGCSVFFTHAA